MRPFSQRSDGVTLIHEGGASLASGKPYHVWHASASSASAPALWAACASPARSDDAMPLANSGLYAKTTGRPENAGRPQLCVRSKAAKRGTRKLYAPNLLRASLSTSPQVSDFGRRPMNYVGFALGIVKTPLSSNSCTRTNTISR